MVQSVPLTEGYRPVTRAILRHIYTLKDGSQIEVVAIAQTSVAVAHAVPDTTQPTELKLDSVPRVFAPDTLSTSAAEFSATFTPDGQTIYFAITDRVFSRMTIVVSHQQNGAWLTPEVAPFSGIWNDGDPSLSPDGKRLYFMSNRPREGTVARTDYDIWYMDRRPDGSWDVPKNAGFPVSTDTSEVSPSVASNGTLYFMRRGQIYSAHPRADGQFDELKALSLRGGNVAVSPDERFIVLVGLGLRPGDTDLFVSCHARSGSSDWLPPRRLAVPVNSSYIEGDPSVTPDGRTLYFASERVPAGRVTWPRPRRASYSEVLGELQKNLYNGLRNLYSVDVSNMCR